MKLNEILSPKLTSAAYGKVLADAFQFIEQHGKHFISYGAIPNNWEAEDEEPHSGPELSLQLQRTQDKSLKNLVVSFHFACISAQNDIDEAESSEVELLDRELDAFLKTQKEKYDLPGSFESSSEQYTDHSAFFIIFIGDVDITEFNTALFKNALSKYTGPVVSKSKIEWTGF